MVRKDVPGRRVREPYAPPDWITWATFAAAVGFIVVAVATFALVFIE